MALTSLELCAGAGGQAIGLEQAGFIHHAMVEIDPYACSTLRLNRPEWNVFETDIAQFDGKPFRGIDLLAGGLPCPPFSVAGKQLGKNDERNLFPHALRLIDEIRPRAIMLENVRGILDTVFIDFRLELAKSLKKFGYVTHWRLLNASDYSVPQLRPRVVFVALAENIADCFDWPKPLSDKPPTVGQTLLDLMQEKGWAGAVKWAMAANDVAPTIVGGSKKHGGPDLGPTRARAAWASLGVDGMGIADSPPDQDFSYSPFCPEAYAKDPKQMRSKLPRLTVRMVARLQGFPDDWQFIGKKTQAYRQVGNAFPSPVAKMVAQQIASALNRSKKLRLVA
ncbi:MAG: DNA cytosine methyltransferase [Alphaproteobacteria bacterium]|nr:DNA cytosine methyltransferase [Alphaproteobacteria bacterium]